MTTASDARGGVLALGGVAFMVMAVAAAYLWHDRGEPDTAVAAAAPEKPLKVYFGGCHEVHEGPVCMLSGTATITLWMEDPGYEPVVLVDGVEVQAPASHDVAGGIQIRVLANSGNSSISIGGAHISTWTLALLGFESDREIDDLRERRRRDPRGVLSAVQSFERTDPRARAALLSIEARAQQYLGQPPWLDTARRAVRAHSRNGNLSGAASELAFIANSLRVEGELDAAEEALVEMRSIARSAPEIVIAHNYFSAILDQQRGDARSAFERLRDIEEWSTRLHHEQYLLPSLQVRLQLLSFVARNPEGEVLLNEMYRAVGKMEAPCERARLLNNLAWFGRTIDLQRSQRAAQEAEELYSDSCTSSGDAHALLRLTHARILLMAGRLESAREVTGVLRRMRWKAIPATTRLAFDELDGQIRLESGDYRRAVRKFADLQRETSRYIEPQMFYRTLVGSARAYSHLNNHGAALRALQEAEDLLDRLAIAVPLGEGRVSFAHEYMQSTLLLIDMLITQGRPGEALAAAERSIRRQWDAAGLAAGGSNLSPEMRARWSSELRNYRQLKQELSREASGVWQLPKNSREQWAKRRQVIEARLSQSFEALVFVARRESRAGRDRIAAGTAEVTIHPTTHGIVVFLRTSTGLDTVNCPDGSDRLVEELRNSAPLRTLLAEVRRVRVRAFGDLLDLPVHAMIQGLAPSPISVGFSVGLTERGEHAFRRRALVVADPDRTLPNSRREGTLVARSLRNQGWQVDVLAGASATRASILAALDGDSYGLLHFAGHSGVEAIDGWRSYLRLSDGERLDVVDVLSVSSVPMYVVLSSCEGAGSGRAPIGVAQAFLLRGAKTVLAAAREVRDEATADLMKALYDETALDPPEARLAAVQWSHRDNPESEMMKFRAFVR